jgi:hypothetical protein
MDYSAIVREDFKEWVALNKHKYSEDLLDSLMKHERFSGFVNNMTRQIKLISENPALKSDRQTLKQVIYSMANAFADLAKRFRDEHYMSEIEKHRKIAEYEARKKIDESSGSETCAVQST